MTERAKRAANELARRGWQVDIDDAGIGLDKDCPQCGHSMRSTARYCENCGTRAIGEVSTTSLDDIEAAIAAALEEAA
jgi:uncharacterized OB-fold protein